MMTIPETVLYVVGFVLVLLYLIFGIDDVIWDLLTFSRKNLFRKNHLDLNAVKDTPPKLLAMCIAAWHEANVIEDVVDNLMATCEYPKSMFHLFLGVYPNDRETIDAADRLAGKYPNVHPIINCKPGPTSKAQNLNYVIRQIREYEKGRKIRFASVTVHDSEDVVHPYELLVTNYMIDRYDALQFPVFPILRMPTLKNFFRTLTTSTYADEFAENHFSTMVGRCSTGPFVPSAGTGFALSRKAVESFGEEDILPTESLTEDYRLSLTLYERGLQMYYILEKLPRIQQDGRVRYEYISTRSLFPKTFQTAVRQKTRWIYGITMQSLKVDELLHEKMPAVGRYSLYRDFKAKYSNLVCFLGYPVLVYWLVSLFLPLPAIYRAGTVPYYLCFVVTGMMLIRLFYRAVAITNVYGLKSMFYSCLFPPLFPIRLVYGNIINLVATLRAFKRYLFGDESPEKKKAAAARAAAKEEKKKTKRVAWDKTDHEFLDSRALQRFHRNLGDTILMHGWADTNQIAEALDVSRQKGTRLGKTLRSDGLLSEQQLLEALAEVQHTVYIRDEAAERIRPALRMKGFDPGMLRRNTMLPIAEENGTLVLAICDETPMEGLRNLSFGKPVRTVFMSRSKILEYLDRASSEAPNTVSGTDSLIAAGSISVEQALLVQNYSAVLGMTEKEVLHYMGLDSSEALSPQPAAVHCAANPSGVLHAKGPSRKTECKKQQKKENRQEKSLKQRSFYGTITKKKVYPEKGNCL